MKTPGRSRAGDEVGPAWRHSIPSHRWSTGACALLFVRELPRDLVDRGAFAGLGAEGFESARHRVAFPALQAVANGGDLLVEAFFCLVADPELLSAIREAEQHGDDGDQPKLPSALAGAREGDTLLLAPGVHPGPLVIRRSISLRGEEGAARRGHLQALIQQFRMGAEQLGLPLMASGTAIQPLMVGDNKQAVNLSRHLEAQGLLISAIRPPTVPAGQARLRITLTAAHTAEDVNRLLSALESRV